MNKIIHLLLVILVCNNVVQAQLNLNPHPINITQTSFRVNWTPYSNPPMNYYQVEVHLNSSYTQLFASTNISGPTYLVASATPGTTYYFRVRGIYSSASEWEGGMVTTLPPPCSIAGVVNSNGSWTKNGIAAWPFSTGDSIRVVDWRLGNQVSAIASSGSSTTGPTATAMDDCGRPVFYAVHTGSDADFQLHLYGSNGTRLTNNTVGHPFRALNAVPGASEIQIVAVPSNPEHWYIIYSLRYTAGCSGNTTLCPAKVAYAEVAYNYFTKHFSVISRDIPLMTSYTYTHGKAVSQLFSAAGDLNAGIGGGSFHYLYLAERNVASVNTTRLVRFKIHRNGIDCQEVSAALYWSPQSLAGSSVELSQDGQKLAFLNQNENTGTTGEDILVFDLAQFNNVSYIPLTLKIQNLMVDLMWNNAPIKKSVLELSTTAPYNSTYSCFQHMRKRLVSIEFSNSGRYLFASGGGYSNTTGNTYNTYLLQIDLQSNGTSAAKDVRIQVQPGVSVNPTTCSGATYASAGTTIRDILYLQSAQNGNLYFTKRNSPQLFVIPFPDSPMPQNLVAGEVDLSNTRYLNVPIPSQTATFQLPEGIDGFDYANAYGFKYIYNVYPYGNVTVYEGQRFNTYLRGYTIWDGWWNISSYINNNYLNTNYSYHIDWGDGLRETVSLYKNIAHAYDKAGTYNITLTQTDPEGCVRQLWWNITVIPCPAARTFTINNETMVCAVKFSTQYDPSLFMTFNWNFGDGNSSTERSPIHAYATAGTYNVSLTVNYGFYGCSYAPFTVNKSVIYSPNSNPLVNHVVSVQSDTRTNILSATASTFKDSWPMFYPASTLEALNNFENGTSGLWRNDATHVYREDRSQAPGLNLAQDGTFQLKQFNWKYAPLQAIPGWIKANQMTVYSPYGYELENKDALGVYSGAVYDYGGQMPVATGTNMKHDEMAFTGFEVIDANHIAGNWIISATAIPAYTLYKVNSGYKNVAVVEASLSQLSGINAVDVFADESPVSIAGNKIVCRIVHPQNANWSIIVLQVAPVEDVWMGQIKVKNPPLTAATVALTEAAKHTGKRSLAVGANNLTFRQKVIKLIPGKKYWINVWASTGNVSTPTSLNASGLGIEIIAYSASGAALTPIPVMLPSGPVIEGWQQIRGSFLAPAGTDYFDIRFKKGAANAYYDDLRLQPEGGNMKAYVYNVDDYRLMATLDEENFASLFFYDKEGNLYLTKKETKEGIKTISENVSYMTH